MTASAGLLLGRFAAAWASEMLDGMNSGGLLRCGACNRQVPTSTRWCWPSIIRCSCGNAPPVRWHLASSLCLSFLFVLFSWLLIDLQCQTVDEVRPASSLATSRLPFHLTLIFLLCVATLTDLLDYVVPDEVVYAGILIAVIGATASGDLQLIHIWVNWDDVIPGVQGPYLPEWMKHHQHLHGLAWSLSGMICGASLTWLVRWLSHKILGYPALGLGDATLMAMIGAFIGWQPTLCVLAIAPMTGMIVGLAVRLLTGRSFVAYGPYLACSAVIVLCTWRWLWADFLTLRDIFSHWPSIAGLIGFSFAALIILLLILRVFRAVPTKSLRR